MKKLLCLLLLGSVLNASAAEIAGVRFEERMQLSPGGPDLVLNGAGLRTFILFKVYAAGLYVEQKSANAQTLIEAAGPRRVLIVMLRDVSAQKFSESFSEGIRDNNSPALIARHEREIDLMLNLMRSAADLKQGDHVRVDYLPERGTRIQINGETKGPEIPGPEFYRMILRVWLGENPVDTGLKEGLLGG